MYNVDLKNKFIEQVNNEASKEIYRRLFSRVSQVEFELDQDLCQISDEDKIQEILYLICGVKKNTTNVVLSRCKQYIQWCLREKVPGATDALLNNQYNSDEKFLTGLVGSAKDLTRCLNVVFDKEIKHTYDNVCRCFFWLAFIGVPLKDVFEIKSSDVDLNKKKITHNSAAYEICDEAMPSITNCVKLRAFMYSHPNYSTDISRDRVNSDQLLRGIKNEAKITTLKPTISKRVNQKGIIQLKYDKVLLSGIFCRMYQRELDGYPINFEEVVRHYLKPGQAKNRINASVSNIEYEYKIWKKVFIL